MAGRVVFVCAAIFTAWISVSTPIYSYNYSGMGIRRTELSLPLTGIVSVVSYSRDNFNLRVEDCNYRVITDKAIFDLGGGRSGRLRDICSGDKVCVDGIALTSSIILASSVKMLGSADTQGTVYYESRSPSKARIQGYVIRVNLRDFELDIRTDQYDYIVKITRSTYIRRYIYGTDIYDIREGDIVAVYGFSTSRGNICAERIEIGGRRSLKVQNSGRNYKNESFDEDKMDVESDIINPLRIEPKVDPVIPSTLNELNEEKDGPQTIIGNIMNTTTVFDRNIVVYVDGIGEVKVDVKTGAKVSRNDSDISVHDIKKGEKVRLTGWWIGTTFKAESLEVIDGDSIVTKNIEHSKVEPTPKTMVFAPVEGRIVKIDYNLKEIIVDFNMQDTLIKVKFARIIRNGAEISFTDIKTGDKIVVNGESKPDAFYASKIEIIE